MNVVEIDDDKTNGVVAWSSSHLSEDDSDEDQVSSTSQSPSRSEGNEGQEDQTADDMVAFEDLVEDWIHDVDVDLPDGHREPSSVKTIEDKPRMNGALTPEPVVRGPSELDHQALEEEPKPRRVSQIPRLTPPFTRKASLDSTSPSTSPSLSRRQNSPSKPQTLAVDISQSQVSPVSPVRRGHSVYIPQGTTFARTTTGLREGSVLNIVSTSSQFWANEQNRRSSRLLDEWKRKEIWHDFKRAEENVLTNPSMTVSPTTTAGALLDGALGSASSLDDVFQGIRSDILTKQGVSRPSLRRATSFAAQSDLSPEKPVIRNEDDVPILGGEVWQPRPSMVMPQAKTPLLESVPNVEYDRLLDEKRKLTNELESHHRALVSEQEATRALQERLVILENSDRENRFLKEEIQKHLMHELSSKELVKTLEDQLGLTARSEDQLKMQTRQLMQQNQALQTDLLEKMAAETAKIQKMAHLTAEKQKLQEDFQRQEALVVQKVTQQRTQVRVIVLRHLLFAKRHNLLKCAFALWHTSSRERTAERHKTATIMLIMVERVQVKALARSFRWWQSVVNETSYRERLRNAEQVLASAHECHREVVRHASSASLAFILRRRVRKEKQIAWSLWTRHTNQRTSLDQRLTAACVKLHALLQSHVRSSKQRAFSTWKLQAFFDGQRLNSERAKKTEAELNEAKDCVFALSLAKTRLEEKLQTVRLDAQRANDELREHRSELQLVKHGFVATVIRESERQWLRAVFSAWRLQSQIDICAKEFRLQLEMAELQVEERAKYARSLDDYNKVLRNELERFQFFSQDKRVAVDVLTKKLLREEDKLKQMEEQHVVLEEKMLVYKSQLASIVEWESGTILPLPLIQLCRDATIGNLSRLFARLANVARRDKTCPSGSPDIPQIDENEVLPSSSHRLAMSDLVQFIRVSNTLSESLVAQSDLPGLVQRNAPDYADTQGLVFTDFIVCLNAVAKEAFDASPTPKERLKAFWSTLLGYMLAGTHDTSGGYPQRDSGDAALHHSRSPWAGKLSEDILQNQEKLLAVLEHETAVVERAVMEKSSLKHTYAPSEHSTGSTVKEFQEYQCEPVVPLESQPTKSDSRTVAANGPSSDCQFRENGLSQFANWSQSGQVLDLFLAFRLPLQRVVTKYSNEKRVAAHDNQVCLLLSGVARMLEDVRLYPGYISRDLVHHHFGRLCDRDGLLTPQAFAVFLGCCALELFAKSLPTASSTGFRLSAREIVLSFFCDLGLLPDSEIPAPPRICLVGADVENVLWPLFEYYSLSDDGPADPQGAKPRTGMTLPKFVRFSADIVNTAASTSERLFQRVMSEMCRPNATSTKGVLHLDEFYVALAYLQADRCPNVQYANLGESVRHWMQQTQ